MTQPHVLILCLDTVRHDYYQEHATRLQDRAAIRFEEMRAASSWSVPSHAAMLTGQLPTETGVHAYQRRFDTLTPGDTWLTSPEFDGYETHAISANVYASPAFGFDALFDHTAGVSPASWFPEGLDVDGHIQNRPDEAGMAHFVKTALQHPHPVKSLANGAIVKATDFMDDLPLRRFYDYGGRRIAREIEGTLTDATEPTLVFANLMDAHGPHSFFRGLDREYYNGPRDWDSRSFADWDVNTANDLDQYEDEIQWTRELYTAEIDYLDRILATLIDRLEDALDREVITVITADHGENLAYESDRYLLNHTSSLTEGLLHVPFDVIAPRSPETVTEYVSHLDMGVILRNLVADRAVLEDATAPVIAELAGSGTGVPDDAEDSSRWDEAMRAVYHPEVELKYVQRETTAATYNITEGSQTGDTQTRVNDSVPSAPFDVFPTSFDELVAAANDSTGVDVDASVEARLKDLGYA